MRKILPNRPARVPSPGSYCLVIDDIPLGSREKTEFAAGVDVCYGLDMTATHVIEEIKLLPPAEQSRVIQFAFELARIRQLPGKNLSDLAQKMADSNDPVEVAKLKTEIARGFYGE